MVLLHVLPVAFVGGDTEEPDIRVVLFPALGREVAADLLVGAADLPGRVELALEPLTLIVVRDGTKRVLGDDTAFVEAVIPHLAEIYGPHVIVILVPSRVVFGGTKLETIEVDDDPRNTEGDADEALPPRGDGEMRRGAVLLVIVDELVAPEEEEGDRHRDRRVAERREPARRMDSEHVRRRTHEEGKEGERAKAHSGERRVTQRRHIRANATPPCAEARALPKWRVSNDTGHGAVGEKHQAPSPPCRTAAVSRTHSLRRLYYGLDR